MKAIIVAGGRGERLKPITDNIPKPMVKVGGKTLLEHTVELLKRFGVTEYIFSLCYLPDVITNYFGDGASFGINIKYTYEDENEPLGTAGAIDLARKYINDTFIVTYADILRKLNINDMIRQHMINRSMATINVYKRFGADPKSVVVFDSQLRVTKFVERPTQDLIKDSFVWANGSFFVFEPEIYRYIKKGIKSDFGSDVFPKVISDRKVVLAYPSDEYFIDIGNPEKLKLAEETFVKLV
jgi:mannose-1-phosphate guanylyltransferase/phosphomannomutase